MKESVKHFLKVLAISLVIVYGAGFIGSFFTVNETQGSWYEAIKPKLTPPGWVFPIVWNILFFLIALSLAFAWTNSNKKEKTGIILIYGINLFCNALWSILYFGMHNPLAAYIDLLAIWLSLVTMIIFSYKISKKASLLLLPYLAWVSFAGILNYLSI